jgi:aspartate/methionine/tyrosine aminotransferase
MQIAPSDLERWFAETAPDAEVTLAKSGLRALSADRFDATPEDLGPVTPTAGDPDFRDDVGGYHGRSAEETVFTCGIQEAKFLTLFALLERHAIVVTPTRGSLSELAESLADVTRVRLSEPEWTLDPATVAEAIRPETDLVAVVNPNSPTGRYHDENTMQAVYEHCADNGTYLLSDEACRPLATDPVPPAASFGRYGISTGGVSTAFGLGGLRFGWLCGSTAVIEAAKSWKDYTTISPPVLGQHVARQAFEQRAEILAANREHVQENRVLVESFLEEYDLGWSDPDCGGTALVEVPEGFAGGWSFCRSLLTEESVVLAPGDAFGRPEWFRIGFGVPKDELETGLSRLREFLDRHA